MNREFKKSMVKFHIVSIIVLLFLITLNSCEKTEIKLDEPTITVRNLRTGNSGLIKSAEVIVSPISERFVFIKYNLIGKDDGLEGNIVFRESFSDTIDTKYEKNMFGEKTFLLIYTNMEGVYHLQIENSKIVLIPSPYKEN